MFILVNLRHLRHLRSIVFDGQVVTILFTVLDLGKKRTHHPFPAHNQALLTLYDIKNALKVLLFYKAFIVVMMLTVLAICAIIL